MSVQCRSTPLIIDATSEDEQRLSWEKMQVEPFSTCQ